MLRAAPTPAHAHAAASAARALATGRMSCRAGSPPSDLHGGGEAIGATADLRIQAVVEDPLAR